MKLAEGFGKDFAFSCGEYLEIESEVPIFASTTSGSDETLYNDLPSNSIESL